jgi:hypothetical protein
VSVERLPVEGIVLMLKTSVGSLSISEESLTIEAALRRAMSSVLSKRVVVDVY